MLLRLLSADTMRGTGVAYRSATCGTDIACGATQAGDDMAHAGEDDYAGRGALGTYARGLCDVR